MSDFGSLIQTGRAREFRYGSGRSVEVSGGVKGDGTIVLSVGVPIGRGWTRLIFGVQSVTQVELNPFTGEWRGTTGALIDPLGPIANFATPGGRISISIGFGTSGVWLSPNGDVFLQYGISNTLSEGSITGGSWDDRIVLGKFEDLVKIIPNMPALSPAPTREYYGAPVSSYDLSNPDDVSAMQQAMWKTMSDAARGGWTPEIALPPRCFLAGTPVLMADGTETPIERVKIGDLVLAFDPAAEAGRGALVPRRVTRTFHNTARTILDLRGPRMTPGHVCLSGEGGGRFETVAAILRRDGTLVDRHGQRLRARTGAPAGSPEDLPVAILYADPATGEARQAIVRAGIPLPRTDADDSAAAAAPATLLAARGLAPKPDGTLRGPDGEVHRACDWPPGATPLDTEAQRAWVVRTGEGAAPYVPDWIAELEAEAAREHAAAGAHGATAAPSLHAAPSAGGAPIGAAFRTPAVLGSLFAGAAATALGQA